MPKFHYTAKRGPRDIVEGIVDAENRGGVLTHLADLGYIPVRITEQDAASASTPAAKAIGPVRARRVPSGHLTIFTRQFASLVRSYVPLLRALNILEEQARHPYFRYVLHQITEDVRQGETLSSGLAKFPQVFPTLYVSLIHSGEVSGALDVILERLAAQMEQDEAMRTKVRMAFTYPAFVGVVGLCTIIFLMTFVMPRLSRLLLGLGERLPLPTRLLLGLAHWMTSWWFWGAAIGGLVGLAALWKGMGPRGRLMVDRLTLRMPLLGPLVLQSEMARFARSFGLQIQHGISILQAIDTATKVVGNRVMRLEVDRLPEGLRQGTALSTCLKQMRVGTPYLINTVAVGEENGKVGEALMEVAAYYERETDRLLQVMATLLEPLLIVTVGLVVGFIVLAVLLPIFEMSGINP